MKSQLINLVKMELFSSKRNLYLFLIMPLVYPALFRGAAGSDAISYLFCICICGFLLFTGFAETDEKYRTNIMLNILPVKRSEIISARYLCLYIVYAGVTLVFIFSAALLHILKPDLFGIYDLNSIPVGLLVLSLLNAIQIPLYYVLDLQRSRIIGTLLMFGAIALFAWVSSKNLFTVAINNLSQMSTASRNFVLLIGSAVFFLISSIISERVYLRKEF